MKPHITYFNRITKGQNSTQFKLYISREMNTEKNQNYFKISFADGHLGCFQYLAIVNCAGIYHVGFIVVKNANNLNIQS